MYPSEVSIFGSHFPVSGNGRVARIIGAAAAKMLTPFTTEVSVLLPDLTTRNHPDECI